MHSGLRKDPAGSIRGGESGRTGIEIPFDLTGWTFGMTVVVY